MFRHEDAHLREASGEGLLAPGSDPREGTAAREGLRVGHAPVAGGARWLEEDARWSMVRGRAARSIEDPLFVLSLCAVEAI